MNSENILSEGEIVEQANADLDAHAESLLDALDAFYLSGFADETSGDVESNVGHFHRVHRWIVRTDSHGFKEVETFDSEAEASARFSELDGFYAEWLGDDDE
jgi:hypothetical protein